jgi:hypothetical protein
MSSTGYGAHRIRTTPFDRSRVGPPRVWTGVTSEVRHGYCRKHRSHHWGLTSLLPFLMAMWKCSSKVSPMSSAQPQRISVDPPKVVRCVIKVFGGPRTIRCTQRTDRLILVDQDVSEVSPRLGHISFPRSSRFPTNCSITVLHESASGPMGSSLNW